jgi:hypothetical protein
LCAAGRDYVRPFHGSLVMKYEARGAPAYFLPVNRTKSSAELRGRWFTTPRFRL